MGQGSSGLTEQQRSVANRRQQAQRAAPFITRFGAIAHAGCGAKARGFLGSVRLAAEVGFSGGGSSPSVGELLPQQLWTAASAVASDIQQPGFVQPQTAEEECCERGRSDEAGRHRAIEKLGW